MNEPLHPSSLGEILDRTVQLYRSRFLVFFGIAVIPIAVVLAFVAIFFLAITWIGADGKTALSPAAVVLAVVFFIVLVLVALPVCLAVTALGTAALNHAVASAWRDEIITIRDAYKSAWQRGWSYIGLFLLETLLVWVTPFVAWFVLVFVGAGAAALAQSTGMGGAVAALVGLGAVLAIAALIGYCIWMLLRLSLAFPASVVERMSATAAIKRSFSLCLGTRGRIFLLYLLGMALNYIFSLVIMVPVLIVIALLPGANNPQNAASAGMVMVFTMYCAAFAIQALTKPVYGIALMLFYYDQRIRKEGYDIEWLMQRAGLAAPAPPQAQQLQQFTEPTQQASQESL
jgi:hypothetical protein